MPITYVFELPTKVVLDIGMILDNGNAWEDVGMFSIKKCDIFKMINLAITMPDIADIDIDDCRRLRDSRDGRPTESLLRIWGSKGYTINDLYKVFARLKLIRCMKIIREYGLFFQYLWILFILLFKLNQICICLKQIVYHFQM